MLDIIIAGAGPAGLSAAIYAARAGLSAAIIEKSFAGGQILNTNRLENYLGFEDGISGFDFSMACRAQAEKLGCKFISQQITAFDFEEPKKIITTKQTLEARGIVLAMGAAPRKLGLIDEEKFEGQGISYCATCDGALYKNKDVAIIGGGDTALEDALYLSAVANKVYVVHRRDEFRAVHLLVERARSIPNIEFVLSSTPQRLVGEDTLTGLELNTGKTLDVSGIFVAIGLLPSTGLLEGIALKDGYVAAGEDTRTSIKRVYAAGDIRTKNLRQVITAASDGANAVNSFLADM